MTAEISIGEAERLILAEPAPLLFLDTCAVLDVLRVASERDSQPDRIVAAAENVAERASSSLKTLWLLNTPIVDIEWRDNVQGVLDGIGAHIARVDRSLVTLHAAIRATKPSNANMRVAESALAAADHPLQIDRFELPTRLMEICERIMASAVRLSADERILRAAHVRSMAGKKPAARGKREHPDCLNIETCFALCKTLRSSHFEGRCVFVSSNKADFYGEGGPLRPHEEMAGECSALGLQFALAFDQALSILFPS
jgi:hypothetical protein